MTRHATTAHWLVPTHGRPNLRELASRPERFEHHLVVVATIGGVQLEVATASEPLYFGHVNISDEYALALPCGDPLVDGFPNMRTFLADATTGVDTGRYNHRVGDLVLHPLGALHWPGRLRAPYAPFAFPPGTRRTGLSLVYCASRPTPSTFVPLPEARPDAAKAYAAPPPNMACASVFDRVGLLARIGETTLSVVQGAVAPLRGGWVVILEDDAQHTACDLLRLAPGEAVSVTRALLFASESDAPDPIAPAWGALPTPPWAPFEDAPPGELPVTGAISIVDAGPDLRVTVGGETATVPRYWLARMLFRVALHQLRVGHVETYGGFYSNDGAGHGDVTLGLRGGGAVAIPRDRALAAIEALYRAVAPPGYVERVT